MSLSLTQAATAAAQFLGVLDSGETLSAQQLTDALAAANNLLANWTNEQTQAFNILIQEQAKKLATAIAMLTAEAQPLATAYTLSGGTYVAATFVSPTYTPGAVLQFADTTTPIVLPAGVDRALKLALAVELAGQYDMDVPRSVAAQAAEARAAAFPVPNRVPIPGTSGQATVPGTGAA